MIALDTNVLVRYLTLDDEVQGAAAVALIDGAAERGEPMFVSAVVLCELAWVLRRAYGYRKPDVETVIEGLLRSAQLRFNDPARLWAALGDYREGSADFLDYLIGREALDAGCSATVTFDGALAGQPGYQVLGLPA